MFINNAWDDNPVWMFGMESIIQIISINGESLRDRDIAELQEIIPGITTRDIDVNFRIIGKWDNE